MMNYVIYIINALVFMGVASMGFKAIREMYEMDYAFKTTKWLLVGTTSTVYLTSLILLMGSLLSIFRDMI